MKEALLLFISRHRRESEFLANCMIAEAALVDLAVKDQNPFEYYQKAKRYYATAISPSIKTDEEARTQYMKEQLKEAVKEGPMRVSLVPKGKKHAGRSLSEMRKQQNSRKKNG